MELRAVIKQSEGWWIGWLLDIPGVNAQEKTRNELIQSLRVCTEEMLETPYQPGNEEELVSIKV